MRFSLLGIVLCFCVRVQKNVSTHIEDGGMWEEKTLGPHNESLVILCLPERLVR